MSKSVSHGFGDCLWGNTIQIMSCILIMNVAEQSILTNVEMAGMWGCYNSVESKCWARG